MESRYAEEDAEEILIDILANGKIKESEKIILKIAELKVKENAEIIEKVVNLMEINNLSGDEILEIAENNIKKMQRKDLDKTNRIVDVYNKSEKSWKRIKFSELKDNDCFRLIESNCEIVKNKNGGIFFTAFGNVYKNENGILTIDVREEE